ncbi:RING finger protein [Acrasis kona]|uniref:RING finger protein n=1 Tax=Acrasis kona TaxID=1008807 RepID=A0AAW2YHR6_9EUKA
MDDSCEPSDQSDDKVGLRKSEMKKLLECQVCNQIFITPFILHCSHTFCKKCVMEYLRKNKKCPCCEKMIIKPPAHNRHVCLLLESFTPYLSEVETAMLNLRKAEHQQYFEEEFKKFENMVKSAQENGTKFLNIERRWSTEEKRIFRIGLERYEGRELELYCKLTGFSKEFINTSLPPALIIAARNVDAQIPQSSQTGINYDLLRDILRDIMTS